MAKSVDSIIESAAKEIAGDWKELSLKVAQRKTVESLLSNQDNMAVLPTGFGKIVCSRAINTFMAAVGVSPRSSK